MTKKWSSLGSKVQLNNTPTNRHKFANTMMRLIALELQSANSRHRLNEFVAHNSQMVKMVQEI